MIMSDKVKLLLVEHDFLLMMYLNQSGVKEQWNFLFTYFFEGAVCCSLTWDKVKSIALIEEKRYVVRD
ncbi:hypothetical protein BK732_25620 [Bacillus thuringiensis serovar navarrensis]|uniref:Uncharacterized protein n=1 Tax=Bacillus thuringiensis serovar navarrensis TaxID=339658 RepID=A0A243A429_BACTU|nr:hypothetical protein BK732_25620 [Bacillus thuringiensis serovar navarrensis]